MSTRTRRLLGGAAGLVVLLLIGRWGVACLSERWWAETLSPAAASFVTRWWLLGLALDGAAIVIASLWFTVLALLVARAIASVQVARRFGDLHLREAVPTRMLVLGAVATGVLLGLITGAGARAWRAPLLLATQGATYGVADPILGEDLGLYVTRLPLWDVAHHFAALLVVVGIAFTALLYAAIGGVRREHGTFVIHADARRQLGGLLALLAGVIAVGYLLVPYHLAASETAPLDTAAVLTRVRAAQLMAGAAVAVALLNIFWAVRGRHGVALGAWTALVLGALIERMAIPVLTDERAPAPARDALVRRFDAIAWAIHVAEPAPTAEAVPAITALWDDGLLTTLADRGGGALLAATQAAIVADSEMIPAWLVATPAVGDPHRLDILAVQDGTTLSGGLASLRRASGENEITHPVWRTLADPRLRPDAPAWRPVAGAVDANGWLRRVALAWARQAPGMMQQTHERAVDWHLDPVDRADALMPMVSWLPADVLMVAGRPTWVVQGLLAIDQFPMATRARWRGNLVAGIVPGFVATMDVATGEVHIHLDPAADSLAVAWGRVAGPLVEPAATLPSEVRQALPYPAAWFEVQLDVLEDAAWVIGRRPERGPLSPPAPSVAIWLSASQGGREAVFEDPDRRAVSAVVTGARTDGRPELRIERYEPSDTRIDNGLELQRLWTRTLAVQHLRDSARAAGDSVVAGPVHWFFGSGAMTAWQPLVNVPAHGPPALLWVATAFGDRVGGGRTVSEAWSSVTGLPTDSRQPAGPGDAVVVEEARHWMRVADSALARDDLTAFGRAIEELRRVLQRH